MRLIIQRVSEASVRVGPRTTGAIGAGLLVFCGVRADDTIEDADYLAARTAALRIFNDAEGKMNRSVTDTGGSVLVVSQFTLHADTRKGNRPSFVSAAAPELADRLYLRYADTLRSLLGVDRVALGEFRAHMDVHLINDGPVTILLRSRREYGPDPSH